MKPKKFKISNILSVAVIFFLLFFSWSPAIQAELISVGVLTFHDESGTGVPRDLGVRVSRDLQQKLVRSYTDLLPRVIVSSGASTMTVEELAQLGRQQGVKFLVRGGILAISGENIGGGVKVSLELYAEIISAGSGKVKSVRARGMGTQRVTYPMNKVPWEAIDTTGTQFQYTAPGQALLNAVEQLAGLVHEAVTAPEEQSTTTTTSQDTGASDEGTGEEGTGESGEYEDTGTQETGEEGESSDEYSDSGYEEGSDSYTDEDLQQLMYQAEEFIYNNSLSEDKLTQLNDTLKKLKDALSKKANLLEQGEDTSEVEQEILKHKNKLEQIMSEATDEASSGEYSEEGEEGYEEATGEKKNLLSSLGGTLDDSINVLQKIKELKSVLGLGGKSQEEEYGSGDEGYEETTGDETTTSEGDEGYEETTDETSGTGDEGYEEDSGEEVTGVVTEDGEPVEGVTVTDEETGATTTTDSSGHYNLGKIPAGRLSELVLKNKGKIIGKGKLDLVKGRASVADWELKPKYGKSKKPALRVMPSAVNVLSGKKRKKYIGKTGTVKGVILGPKGKPVSRALVKLKGLGTARTDSKGRYVFMKVPAGNHQVVVQKSGQKVKTQQVQVIAKKSSTSKIRFSPTDRVKRAQTLSKMVSRASSTHLWGRITDAKKRPLRGAKVLVIQSGRSLSTNTDATGKYQFKNLNPGAYRILVSKAGFKNGGGTVALRSSKKKKSNFKLQAASRYIQSALAKNRAKRGTTVQKQKTTRGKPVLSTIPRTKGKTTSGKTTTQTTTTRVTTPLKLNQLSGKAGGTVSGLIRDSKTKRPIASVLVSIRGARKTYTNNRGLYTVPNMPPGRHTITVNRKGYYAQVKQVIVKSKRSNRKDFQLKSTGKSKSQPKLKPFVTKPGRTIKMSPKTKTTTKTKTKAKLKPIRKIIQYGQIRGFVMDARTRKAISGASISISGARGTSSGRSGSFITAKLKTGRYTVVVSRSGYGSSRKTVVVQAGRTASATFYLTPRAVRKLR
ncbi:MAG: carboxypeptidase regulatory-like domain-containing protein [bacterium]|nr:carboxypeptidase regulatory-like domain-containing protein [bacterium]